VQATQLAEESEILKEKFLSQFWHLSVTVVWAEGLRESVG